MESSNEFESPDLGGSFTAACGRGSLSLSMMYTSSGGGKEDGGILPHLLLAFEFRSIS